MTDNGEYIAKLLDCAASRRIDWPTSQNQWNTKAYLATRNFEALDRAESCETWEPAELAEHGRSLAPGDSPYVCIIENISPKWIEALGVSWDINPHFFVDHAENPTKEDFWSAKLVDLWQKKTGRRYCSLNGTFEYHGRELRRSNNVHSSPNFFYRHIFKTGGYPPQANTRISYYRSSYLFLLDAPLESSDMLVRIQPRIRTTLRLPYMDNRGGLMLPQLFHRPVYSLFESLQNFLSHDWHFGVLYSGDGRVDEAVEIHPFLYALSSSLWLSNLRYLEDDIKRISFVEIRNPDRDTNAHLHDKREDLYQLKTAVAETESTISEALRDYLERFPLPARGNRAAVLMPLNNHPRILADALKLEAFLMETFQLLMSSISAQDSQLSLDEARRSSLITWLAFIYVPLSFVTGIFGMNLKEINGSPLSLWVSVITLAIILGCTGAIFGAYKLRQDRKILKVSRRNRLSG